MQQALNTPFLYLNCILTLSYSATLNSFNYLLRAYRGTLPNFMSKLTRYQSLPVLSTIALALPGRPHE